MHHRRLRLGLASAGVLMLIAPAVPAVPVGTAFTYQGQLIDSGTAANGTYDLQFKLFDAAVAGAQVGPTLERQDLAVTDGVFTITLDFGGVFDGQARFLEIGVRPGSSTGGYILLSPRQPLTATPYALHASAADSTPWSGVTGVPAGFADGIDNDTTYTAGTGLALMATQFSVDPSTVQSRVTGACAAGSSIRGIDANGGVLCQPDTNSGGTITGVSAGTGLTGGGTSGSVSLNVAFAGTGSATTAARSDHQHDADYQAKYRRTVVVGPVGTAAQNGSAVLAALAGVTDSSCSNPYLIKLEPGTYDLGSASLTMKPCVDIEGSGEVGTLVTASGNAGVNTGTIVGPANAELRWLTVRNTGGNTAAVALYSSGAALKLTHVTAIANGATNFNYAVYSTNSSFLDMTHVTAEGTGGQQARAIFNSGSSPFMTDVRATAAQASINAAVYNDAATPVMVNVDAAAQGGSTSYGVFNSNGSFPLIRDGTVFAQSAATNYGVYNTSGSGALLFNVDISVSGGTSAYGVYDNGTAPGNMSGIRVTAFGASEAYGIYNSATAGSYLVEIDNSQITATTNTIHNDSEFTTHVGASALKGGSVAGPNVRCAGVYDAGYTFFSGPACP